MAADRGWWAVRVEAGSGSSLRELLGEALYDPLSDLARLNVGRRLLKALRTALSFKASYDATGTWNFGVDLSAAGAGGGADTGTLKTDLLKLVKDLSLAAREEEIGLAILIDEAQDLRSEELLTLAVTAHAAAQDNWPVLFGFAGLPSLPQTLAEEKSYTERFRYTRVERLDEPDARSALVLPAEKEGVAWEESALERVVRASGRYPYFIQQFGQKAWDAATGSAIDLQSAKRGGSGPARARQRILQNSVGSGHSLREEVHASDVPRGRRGCRIRHGCWTTEEVDWVVGSHTSQPDPQGTHLRPRSRDRPVHGSWHGRFH